MSVCQRLDLDFTEVSLLFPSNRRQLYVVARRPREDTISEGAPMISGSNKPVVVVEQGGVGSAPRRSLYVIDVYLSSQLATNEGAGTNETSAYVVGTPSLFFVVRQDPRVERDSSRPFKSDESEIRCILRAGVAVVYPKSVCRITGIL